jgi:site-specific recombinase XerD
MAYTFAHVSAVVSAKRGDYKLEGKQRSAASWVYRRSHHQRDMLRVVKDRCREAGLSEAFCNHTFRGTGITVFLHNGGALEAAQNMANHSDPRTTKLYDRRKDLATLSEIEQRITFE